MASTAEPKPQPQFGALGIFWLIWCISWTLAVAGGMLFLWKRRNIPMLRIRGLPLSFAALFWLHLYWGAAQTAYVYAPMFSVKAEFWIMGLWLPFGVALFHASNSRFLYIAAAQKKFATGIHEPRKARSKRGGLIGKFLDLDHTKRMLALVGAGMVLQFFLTLVMWLVSRKFHPSFGVKGTEVHRSTRAEVNTATSRGWEWWPSVFWQFFWAWIVAPVILWKSRNIHDTQGWRTQTIACCIANLHATPMWLIALYSPAFAKVNKYWVPPQWLALSIFLMEIFTVFLPCWQVRRHQSLQRETLDCIAQWESNHKGQNRESKSVMTGSTTVAGSAASGWRSMVSKDGSTKTASNESIYTMGALEYVLERNPEPLQQFSALRDFSGENIAFLTSVSEWKISFPAAVRDPARAKDESTQQLVRERFNSALRIYTSFVSSRDAEFQINLSSNELSTLENVFEKAARILYGEKRAPDPATPFDTTFGDRINRVESNAPSMDRGSDQSIVNVDSVSQIGDKALYWGDIPDGFDATIFDDSEASIKYLVLTNTWPKFVRDRRISIDSADAMEAGNGLPRTMNEKGK